VTWRRILTAPGVFISCFALCFAGTAWSWYSASLEPFLDETYGLSSSSTGLVFMCFGIAYTVFTPLFGFLSDRGLSGPAMLIIGNGFICLGMAFLGPIPPLQKLLGSHAWVTVVSISIQGLGSAASYLGTLTFMLQGCSMVGLPDNDKVKSMVSSLWVVSDCGGGYIGSTLGSIAYDRIGFQWATVMETGALAITVGVLIIYWIVQGCNKTEKQMEVKSQVESQAEVGYQVERESRFEPELQADRVTGGVNTTGRDYGSTKESNQQLEV